jgi:hypothetical protein
VTRTLKIGSYTFELPASRIARITIGIGLILLGFLGFLPVLGFWMIPLGFLILSYDIPFVRRLRRRIVVWWNKDSGAA